MKQGGYTLPGVMIVLAISAVITLMSYRIATVSSRSSDLKAVNFSAEVIGRSMSKYYLAHCTEASFPQPSLSDLTDNYIPNPSYIDPPIDITFVPSIINVGSDDGVQFVVTANMPDSKTAKWYENKYGNTEVTGSQVQWFFSSILSSDSDTIRLQQLREAYGNDQC
jgi:type II secretory pathway pseudopilin PulG